MDLFDHKMEVLSSEEVYKAGKYSLTSSNIAFTRFDGRRDTHRWLLYHRGNSVAVLLIDPLTGKLCLIEQFRPATTAVNGVLVPALGGGILEIIAGSQEGDEDLYDCLHREVAEEVGRRIRNIRKVTNSFFSPGGSSEKIFVCLADDAGKSDLPGGGLESESEDIRTHWVTPQKALAMIRSGEICDAKTVLAIQAYVLEKLGY